jgi:hypothetical protein
MTNEGPRDPAHRTRITDDRRKPVARYVEFGDEDTQTRFIAASENAYRRLVGLDRFAVLSHVELPVDPPTPATPRRRGLFRRPPQPAADPLVVRTTAALATVARIASETPGEVQSSPNGCTSIQRVALLLATVATDRVGELLALDPAEQPTHPAYRQTLRLAAELEGVRDTLTHVGCTNPEACVGIRPPEHRGRRVEDVEVSEVRAVLLKLALAGEDAREHE